MRVPTCVWSVTPALVTALDEHLGTPIDSYVNGSQTWLVDDGPGGVTLEWRLHPVAAYRPPGGMSHYDLWETVIAALAAGESPAALVLGSETRPLTSLWDGLEAFPAHGDELEPAPLAAACTDAIGVPPDHAGLVDHGEIADAWEQARGKVSIVALLVDQLTRP